MPNQNHQYTANFLSGTILHIFKKALVQIKTPTCMCIGTIFIKDIQRDKRNLTG